MTDYVNILLTDIDECLTDNGGCGQVCTNTAGSFVCSCNQGFTLASDGRNCTGKLHTSVGNCVTEQE